MAQTIRSFLILIFLAPQLAAAATLFVSPPSASLQAGQTFTANVMVASTDQSINAVSGTVTYSPASMEVVSVSRASSILTLWVQEPAYSNTDGTISFSGVVPNPGYQGASGRIFSITFKTLKSASAQIGFSAASVLANDGNGTNILSGTQPASILITAPQALPPPPPTPVVPAPKKQSSVAPVVAATSAPIVATTAPMVHAVPMATAAPEMQVSIERDVFGIPVAEAARYALALCVFLIILALLILWYVHSIHRRLPPHQRLQRAHAVLRQQFSELNASLLEEIAALERVQTKRALTTEEEKFIKSFRKKLKGAMKVIDQEISDALGESVG